MTTPTGIANFTIKPATKKDVPVILSFITKLADYERLSHEVVATEALLQRTLFGQRRTAEVVIGYHNNEPIGFVLFFFNFSTFVGRAGIFIEDLFVEEAYRRRGFGGALLAHIAKLAVQRDCGRLEWSVLDWNEPAVNFYRKLGAVPMKEWTVFRMTGEKLNQLAER